MTAEDIFSEYGKDPVKVFASWFEEARKQEAIDPDAMALATVDEYGKPAVRMVLLKDHSGKGFVFYTNFSSAKGKALIKNPFAELNFYWKSLGRQVRIAGKVEKTSDAEADAYFASRPRASRIGAWASDQSQLLAAYGDLGKNVERLEQHYAGMEVIPRPPHWGGFRLVPERMEFWIADTNRLHKRFVYEREGGSWKSGWLYP